MIHAMEQLSLHRVEVLESLPIDLFEEWILQSRDRKRLKIQEIRIHTFGVRAD
jgi:hypothetical protein